MVIGGKVTSSGRIEAQGIVAIHVQGDMDGVVEARGMTALWIGGDLRGRADSGVLSAIEQHGYTELNIVVSASDLEPGIHPVSGRHSGFVAVTSGAAGGS